VKCHTAAIQAICHMSIFSDEDIQRMDEGRKGAGYILKKIWIKNIYNCKSHSDYININGGLEKNDETQAKKNY
jgi:hypothetical protein